MVLGRIEPVEEPFFTGRKETGVWGAPRMK
jgi:hypothetical protein